MYKLVAKVMLNNRIYGYILRGSNGIDILWSVERCIMRASLIDNAHAHGDHLRLNNKGISELNVINSELLLVTPNESIKSTASIGNQPKWFKDNIWIKGDTQGYEGLAEEIISKFIDCFCNIQKVDYKSALIMDRSNCRVYRGCYSNSMIKNNESFVTLSNILTRLGIDIYNGDMSASEKIHKTIEAVKNTCGIDITEYILNNLYLDQIVCNEDRHLHNLGVIINNNGKARIAPIFDNGMGLFARQTQWCGCTYNEIMKHIKFEPFGNNQIKSLMNDFPSYKLKLDVRKYSKLRDDYRNSLYSSEEIKSCFRTINIRLKATEGKLWEIKK